MTTVSLRLQSPSRSAARYHHSLPPPPEYISTTTTTSSSSTTSTSSIPEKLQPPLKPSNVLRHRRELHTSTFTATQLHFVSVDLDGPNQYDIMPTPIISTLPVELLALVFSFACNDSGQTGCALRLVCKSFRWFCLETGVDIRSVRVCGRRRLERFLDMLDGRDVGAMNVESLFMSYDAGRKRNEERDYVQGQKDSEISTHLMDNVLAIMNPRYLRILHIEYPRNATSFLLKKAFPRLEELSVLGELHPNAFTAAIGCAPSLKRLSLKIRDQRALPSSLGAALTLVCPSLTHLRITLFPSSVHALESRNALLRFLQMYRDQNLNRPHDARSSREVAVACHLPPELRSVTVGFMPAYISGRNDELSRTYNDGVQQIRGLVVDKLGPLPLDGHDVHYARWADDWLHSVITHIATSSIMTVQVGYAFYGRALIEWGHRNGHVNLERSGSDLDAQLYEARAAAQGLLRRSYDLADIDIVLLPGGSLENMADSPFMFVISNSYYREEQPWHREIRDAIVNEVGYVPMEWRVNCR
ncbi:hypothetical protein EIP91_010243 [Steccherinum ochraceum]|uniref:F-box domain-containing protein n=1 Tax=Steccherinum ochraceum TaxID=92696 RepID=A0A4R0R0U4_9APHY|nr:hypothetical protein EIP91_010243 [Steccherinum ochraceum]